MIKANQEIRDKLEVSRVYQWQLAQRLGVSDTHFCKMMRREFTPERKEEVLKAIDELARA